MLTEKEISDVLDSIVITEDVIRSALAQEFRKGFPPGYVYIWVRKLIADSKECEPYFMFDNSGEVRAQPGKLEECGILITKIHDKVSPPFYKVRNEEIERHRQFMREINSK